MPMPRSPELQNQRERAKDLLALSRNRIFAFEPRPKQKLFMELGATKRERALLGGNRTGKTHGVAGEVTYHLTGRYPPWWKGKRFSSPVIVWAGCTSAEQARDGAQKKLLGEGERYGTGLIPFRDVADVRLGRSVSGGVDHVYVRHVSGGMSRVNFKSYDQRRSKWQVEGVDVIWLDEEPSMEIYKEALTRTNERHGIVMLSATPLLGMTDVMDMFYPDPNTKDRALVMMTVEDSLNFTEEQIEKIEDSYEDYEREARTKGIPILGSGRVFPLSEKAISIPPFPIPSHWGQLGCIDFGWDHPTAAALLAYDPDADRIVVTRTYRKTKGTPAEHAMTLRHWGDDLYWAWPRDGSRHQHDGGQPMAEQYLHEGLKMLATHATFPMGGLGLEAGVMEMIDRMRTGRFQVFEDLEDFFEEFRVYHRKDGQIVDRKDDLLSAVRIGMMMIRYAKIRSGRGAPLPQRVGMDYDPLGSAQRPRETWDPLA